MYTACSLKMLTEENLRKIGTIIKYFPKTSDSALDGIVETVSLHCPFKSQYYSFEIISPENVSYFLQIGLLLTRRALSAVRLVRSAVCRADRGCGGGPPLFTENEAAGPGALGLSPPPPGGREQRPHAAAQVRDCPPGSRGGDQGGGEGRLLLLTRLHPAGAQHRHGGRARSKFSSFKFKVNLFHFK
jgi:hypothetical protein